MQEEDWDQFEVGNYYAALTPHAAEARHMLPPIERDIIVFDEDNDDFDEITEIDEPPLQWYEKPKLPFQELPPNVREELTTWALCYNNKRAELGLPRELFDMVCGWVKTPMNKGSSCCCDIEHCYTCTQHPLDAFCNNCFKCCMAYFA